MSVWTILKAEHENLNIKFFALQEWEAQQESSWSFLILAFVLKLLL